MCLISWLVDVFDQLICLIGWCVWFFDVFDQMMCLISWCVWLIDVYVFYELMYLVGWSAWLAEAVKFINKMSDLRFLYIFQVCEPVEQKVPKITCEKLKHWNLGKQKIKALKSHHFPILSFNFYTQRYLERTIILRNPN